MCRRPLFANLAEGEGLAGEKGASPPTGGATATQPQGTSDPAPEPPGLTPGEMPPSPEQARPEREAPETTPGRPDSAAASGTLDTVIGRRRPARYGLLVQFESRPGDSELGRLVDSTIWINDAHPAFTRATASRSLGYHTALAVALALAPLAVETPDEHAFITQFLAHWGSAQATVRPTRRVPRKRTT